MGTITARRRKSGTVGYTAQIRLRRGGAIVYQEAQTFDRRQAAVAWLRRREAELAEPGALERAQRPAAQLREVIGRYLDEMERVRPLGRTKRGTLRAIAAGPLGDIDVARLTSVELVDYARQRFESDGVQPQTIANDLAHLGAVLSVARPAWGYEVDTHAMPDARVVLRKMGLVTRTRERDRRPTLDELARLLAHFMDMLRRRPTAISMPKVVAFAIFSTRRQEEITRIRWSDLNVERQSVIVRDMKNPGQKLGNDVECHLPDEAWAILQSMPRSCDEIFPYCGESIGTAFRKACAFLEIEDLHFHDLRHEGVSRLFEMDWDIPRVASVSGHRDWNSLRRYTHLRGRGDRYMDWEWLPRIIELPVQLGARTSDAAALARAARLPAAGPGRRPDR